MKVKKKKKPSERITKQNEKKQEFKTFTFSQSQSSSHNNDFHFSQIWCVIGDIDCCQATAGESRIWCKYLRVSPLTARVRL